MKLYVWESSACANYGPGTVAAIGETADEARGRAFSALVEWARNDRGWLFMEDGSVCPAFADDWSELLQKINADLEAEPKTVTALVVTGSN
jgi:hypothetical protein